MQTDGVNCGAFFIVQVVVVVVFGDVADCAALLSVLVNNFQFTSMGDTFLDRGLTGLHDLHADVFLQSGDEQWVFEKTF